MKYHFQSVRFSILEQGWEISDCTNWDNFKTMEKADLDYDHEALGGAPRFDGKQHAVCKRTFVVQLLLNKRP